MSNTVAGATQLVAVMEMMLLYHESGIRILTGDAEPTSEEIDGILCSLSQTDELPQRCSAAFPSSPQERAIVRVESILDIVAQAGGWKGIAMMTRDFRDTFPKTWDIFRAHVEWISGPLTRCEEETAVKRIADRFGVSPDTVQRKRNFVLPKIACSALTTDRVLI